MNTRMINIALYPAKADEMSSRQRHFAEEYLRTNFQLDDDAIEQIFNDIVDIDAIDIPQNMSYKDRLKLYKAAFDIVECDAINFNHLQALSKIASKLNIKKDDTFFDFNIFDQSEIVEHEYKKSLLNFSMIAGVVGFIPLPISDVIILTPIQIGMVSKIANLYGFKMDASEFVKIILGTVGAGVIMKLGAKILNSLIPFIGWAVNGSVAFAGTYALGIITKRYAEAQGNLSQDSITRIWEESFEEGKVEFGKLKEFILSKKDELIKEFQNLKNKQENSDTDSPE